MAKWPEKLNPELEHILGMQCFQFITFAQCYRAAGVEIAHRAESEQAFFLHKLLGFYFTHGAEWRNGFREELLEMRARAASLSPSSGSVSG